MMLRNLLSTCVHHHGFRRCVYTTIFGVLSFYVVAYIEENVPTFRITRITMRNDTTMESTRISSAYEALPPTEQSNASDTPWWATNCQNKGGAMARSFVPQKNSEANNSSLSSSNPPYWCTQDESYKSKSCHTKNQMLCDPTGLLFVKTPKTGSTTLSRVAKRMAQNTAARYHVDKCTHQEGHVTHAGHWYGNRIRDRSFLFTSIRDPATRAMSRFFWSYATHHTNHDDNNSTATTKNDTATYSDEYIQAYLDRTNSIPTGCTSRGQGGYQLNYVTLHDIPEWSAWTSENTSLVLDPSQIEANVQAVVADYDFIVLNERMEESLVVLQLMLGLEPGDLVSLSYNVAGSYIFQNGKCVQLAKNDISSGMQTYFQSEEWYARNYGDYILYAAANRSLDLTIAELGRDRVDEALQEFHRLEALVNEICTQKVPFPCSENGTVIHNMQHSLPHEEIAKCIDEVARNAPAQNERRMTEDGASH